MLKRTFALCICLVFLSSSLCACQKKQALDNSSTWDLTNTSETDNISQWKGAYLDFIENKKNSYLSYALVYIDGDNIPELYLSGIDEATGDSICAYKNGTIIEQPLHRIGGGWYIEKSGNIANQNGHMGQKHTHVYKLVEEGFVQTFEALFSERINDEYKPYYEYSIGDELTTEFEYTFAVETAFDFKNAKRINKNEVNYNSIQQQIIDFN